ncbi:MAG: hypothetical protein HWQ35_32205 [Nostoc sp. NMS1]|uniref:hypothetical protein n=1 Tax=unclassified Nostoc TaxID=2593658 RepID=UPI0025D5E8FC|nr:MULTISPECIES: hypothetical protein [unclassified Nostoc]MBN3911036.1 hypothetical protein [Nostoc sp. NMS1]MBN3990666.1 hypothetical protein [Nostoc sp. NMS2]
MAYLVSDIGEASLWSAIALYHLLLITLHQKITCQKCPKYILGIDCDERDRGTYEKCKLGCGDWFIILSLI